VQDRARATWPAAPGAQRKPGRHGRLLRGFDGPASARCRLLGLEPDAQKHIFDFYQAMLEATIAAARKEGKYDEGIVDVSGTSVTLGAAPRCVRTVSQAGVACRCRCGRVAPRSVRLLSPPVSCVPSGGSEGVVGSTRDLVLDKATRDVADVQMQVIGSWASLTAGRAHTAERGPRGVAWAQSWRLPLREGAPLRCSLNGAWAHP
jgi:C-terminal domain on Strawberry notch homologue